MHIWTIESWRRVYAGQRPAAGLWLHVDREVEASLQTAFRAFAQWLRREYAFPVRVFVYVKATPWLRAMDGERVSALFWEPGDRRHHPTVRIAAGDVEALAKRWGREQAIWSCLHTLAHELTHYFQWINDLSLTDRGAERQATSYAGFIMDEYEDFLENKSRP